MVKYSTVPSHQQKKVCPNILFCDSYYVIDEESKNVDERNNSRSKESSLKKVVKNKNVAKKTQDNILENSDKSNNNSSKEKNCSPKQFSSKKIARKIKIIIWRRLM